MIEIERKFRVKGDFYPFVTEQYKIFQGYLCATTNHTVRVRIKNEKAFLTIKGPSDKNGVSRIEFEYPIPLIDAIEMMNLCNHRIEKERFLVPVGKHTYEVDVFHGHHEGLIIAELELTSIDEVFERPEWLGEEVTGQPEYYNAYLAQKLRHFERSEKSPEKLAASEQEISHFVRNDGDHVTF